MKFSIIHPTARVKLSFDPFWWVRAMSSAASGCDNLRDVEYILVVHESRMLDLQTEYAVHAVIPRFGRFTIVTNYGRDCLVDQCNAGQLAAQGEIILANQDDMRYPEHWDTEIAKLISDTSRWICVQAKTDGGRRDLLTLPTIITRSFADRMGPISPEYDGMFSDNEFSEKARMWGEVLQSDLYFPHLHPAYKTGDGDSVHEMENREEAYLIGRKVFQQRRAQGFPRVELPGWPAYRIESNIVTPEEVRQAGEYDVPRKSLTTRAADWLERTLNGVPSATITFDPATMMPRPTRKLIVCLPGEDHVRMGAILQLVKQTEAMRFEFDGILGYTTAADVTRMALAETVVESFKGQQQAPYVLWFDDDNIVSPEQLARLVAFLDANVQADIVVGWCWIKRESGWATSVGQFDDNMHVTYLTPMQMRANGTEPQHFPMLASGFPCVLMRREVLEHLGALSFAHIQRSDFSYGRMGEDYSFFWRAHQAGMKCYVDPLCKVLHIKPEAQEPHLEIPNEMWCDPNAMKEEGQPV